MIKKYFSSGALQLSGVLLSALTTIFLSRALGPDNFGLIGYVTSIVMLFSTPVIAGLPQYLIREIANYSKGNDYSSIKILLQWSLKYVISFSVITTLVYFFLGNMLLSENIGGMLLLVSAPLIILRTNLYRGVAILNGLSKNYYSQILEAVSIPILSLLMYTAVLLFGFSLVPAMVFVIQSISIFILVIICHVFTGRYVNSFVSSTREVIHIDRIKELAPFFAVGIITGLNAEVSSVILGFISGSENVAYLKVALQLGIFTTISMKVIGIITSPTLARLFAGGDLLGAQEVITKSIRMVFCTTFPIVFITFIYAYEIIVMLFGNEYSSAAPLVRVLCVGYFFDVLSGQVGTVLLMSGLEKYSIYGVLVSLIINIILLLILIPLFGVLGGAYAVTISLIIWNLIANIIIFKKLNIKCWLT